MPKPEGPQFEGIHDPNTPFQLPLFMTGTELKGVITHSIDKGPFETMDQMWESKTRRSKGRGRHGGGTYSSLLKDGWQPQTDERAVNLWHRHKRPVKELPSWDSAEIAVSNAHHRIAAAADMEEKGKRTIYFPVLHESLQFGMTPEE